MPEQEPYEKPAGIPTILMVERDAKWVEPLTEGLEELGCLVLRAKDGIEALLIAQVHSRPIHFLVLEGDAQNRALAETLRAYRTKMEPVFVSPQAASGLSDESSAEIPLAKIREFLNRPKAKATHA